ncbi:hypothetical protein [Rhizobium sp.]
MVRKDVGKILSTLLQLEYQIRQVREDLSAASSNNSQSGLGEVDFGSLIDVTPNTWKEWFTDLKYTTPTNIDRYFEFLPDLLIGYQDTYSKAVCVEQQPRSVAGVVVRHSIGLWMVDRLPWLTLEMRIPTDIFQKHKTLYLAWSATLDTSQKIKIWIYERNNKNEEIRTQADERFFPSSGANEIHLLKLSDRNDIVETKIFMEFDINSFHLIKLDEVRLYTTSGGKELE